MNTLTSIKRENSSNQILPLHDKKEPISWHGFVQGNLHDRCLASIMENFRRFGRAALVNHDKNFKFFMRKKIITLGRSSSRSLVDLQMGPDPAISRHHAKIFYDEGTGSYNLRVSGSNGMLVNGKHHASGSDVLLADKAILQAGTFTCVFEVEPHKEWEEAMRAGASVLDSFRVEKIHACSESSQVASCYGDCSLITCLIISG